MRKSPNAMRRMLRRKRTQWNCNKQDDAGIRLCQFMSNLLKLGRLGSNASCKVPFNASDGPHLPGLYDFVVAESGSMSGA
jgi:hypothetical protein